MSRRKGRGNWRERERERYEGQEGRKGIKSLL